MPRAGKLARVKVLPHRLPVPDDSNGVARFAVTGNTPSSSESVEARVRKVVISRLGGSTRLNASGSWCCAGGVGSIRGLPARMGRDQPRAALAGRRTAGPTMEPAADQPSSASTVPRPVGDLDTPREISSRLSAELGAAAPVEAGPQHRSPLRAGCGGIGGNAAYAEPRRPQRSRSFECPHEVWAARARPAWRGWVVQVNAGSRRGTLAAGAGSARRACQKPSPASTAIAAAPMNDTMAPINAMLAMVSKA
jgi:hypothetical protein